MSQQKIITREKVFHDYSGEWVCLEVVQEDKSGQTLTGKVIAHGRNREEVDRAEMEFIRKNPGKITHIFYAGPIIEPDVAVILCL